MLLRHKSSCNLGVAQLCIACHDTQLVQLGEPHGEVLLSALIDASQSCNGSCFTVKYSSEATQ